LQGTTPDSYDGNTAVGGWAMKAVRTGSANSALGAGALQSLTFGASSTAMGFQALQSNTTGLANTGIGYRALALNVDGSANIAIGVSALTNLTTGDGSVAIGGGSLYNYSGNANTAVGFGTLYSAGVSDARNTALGYEAGFNTGSGGTEITDNTAIGHQALFSNTNGTGNTSLGSRSLYYGTANDRTAIGRDALFTGGSNGATAIGAAAGANLLSSADYFTAVGYLAGNQATTGDWNTFVGYMTGYENTSGGVNTAVGSHALYTNTTGGYNTAMGQGALYTMDNGFNNTAVGAHSGFYVSGTSSYNTSLGYRSLYGSASQGSTGEYNTALGALTLEDNTTGNRNVAVGAVALTNNTTGYNNVGIGVDSLQQNTSGFRNVAVGFEASLNNLTGDYNTAVGHNALKGVGANNHSNNTAVGAFVMDAITTGYGNSGLGYGALSTVSSGGYNTAMGFSSLGSVSTAGGNSAFGYEAAFYDGTGQYNTAMGYNALKGASTYNASYNTAMGAYALDAVADGASYNVATGYGALGAVNSGLYNVGIGYNAGTNITSGSGNTFLGYGANASGNFSNATAIGYNASVGASNRAMIGNGQAVGGSSAWNFFSDSRMKYDIADNNLGLEFINALRTRSFRFTATSTMANAGQLEEGFIAQEVEQAMIDLDVNFSGLRTPENANDFYRLEYSKFTIPLVNAVQELYASSSPLWNGIEVNPSFVSLDEPFMNVDLDGNVAFKGTSITAQGTATTSTQAFDSYTFSFMGSAWNSDTAQDITTSFDVFNNTISATSSELKFIYTSSTGFSENLLTITNAGDVKVSGDLHVGRRLYLGSKTSGEASTSTYIFVDDTLGASSTYIATNADGWQANTSYDYAERYVSTEELEPGDLVVADKNGINKVKRSTSSQDIVLGIVSTKPGFMTGGPAPDSYPIALAGRVPTKVSSLNGKIEVGDFLAPSDIPGVAVKAVGKGSVIGIALESYDKPGEGYVSVFVNISYMGDKFSSGEVIDGAASTDIKGFAYMKAGSQEVVVTYSNVSAYPIVQLFPQGYVSGNYSAENITNTSFTIKFSEPQDIDLKISYILSIPNVDSTAISDGTLGALDTLTGQFIGPTYAELITPTDTEDTDTTTSTDLGTSTSTDPVISDPEPEPTPTDPVVSDPEPATSSTTMVSSTDTLEPDVTASSTWPVTGGDAAASTTQNGV
jgi:hypothetical protein